MKITSCTEWLFYHLWKKNQETNLSCPGIFILDTIIYRWSKPHFWYFTNKQGDIIRKTKERILNDDIDLAFNIHSNQKHEVLAKYLVSQAQTKNKFEKNIYNDQIDKITIFQEKITHEYLNTNNWKFFLYQREKEPDGILQKFIEPKGNHNSLIKVTWSPQFRLMERKTNIYDVNNKKIEFRIKLSTWEGPEYLLLQEQPLSPIICADIELVCQNIQQHLINITAGNVVIQKMVIFFMLDDKNRLWLLYCTSLKLRDMDLFKSSMKIRVQSPIMRMSTYKSDISSKKGTLKATSNGYINGILNNFENYCSNCERLYSNLLDLKFKQIIETFQNKTIKIPPTILPADLEKQRIEQEASNNCASKQKLWKKKKIYATKEQELQEMLQILENEQKGTDFNFESVPLLISKVWGSVNKQKYNELKKNQSWLNFSTKVCDECYLQYTTYMLEPDVIRQTRINQKEIMYTQQDLMLESDFNKNEKKIKTHDDTDDLIVQKPQKINLNKQLSDQSIQVFPLISPQQKDQNKVKEHYFPRPITQQIQTKNCIGQTTTFKHQHKSTLDSYQQQHQTSPTYNLDEKNMMNSQLKQSNLIDKKQSETLENQKSKSNGTLQFSHNKMIHQTNKAYNNLKGVLLPTYVIDKIRQSQKRCETSHTTCSTAKSRNTLTRNTYRQTKHNFLVSTIEDMKIQMNEMKDISWTEY